MLIVSLKVLPAMPLFLRQAKVFCLSASHDNKELWVVASSLAAQDPRVWEGSRLSIASTFCTVQENVTNPQFYDASMYTLFMIDLKLFILYRFYTT